MSVEYFLKSGPVNNDGTESDLRSTDSVDRLLKTVDVLTQDSINNYWYLHADIASIDIDHDTANLQVVSVFGSNEIRSGLMNNDSVLAYEQNSSEIQSIDFSPTYDGSTPAQVTEIRVSWIPGERIYEANTSDVPLFARGIQFSGQSGKTIDYNGTTNEWELSLDRLHTTQTIHLDNLRVENKDENSNPYKLSKVLSKTHATVPDLAGVYYKEFAPLDNAYVEVINTGGAGSQVTSATLNNETFGNVENLGYKIQNNGSVEHIPFSSYATDNTLNLDGENYIIDSSANPVVIRFNDGYDTVFTYDTAPITAADTTASPNTYALLTQEGTDTFANGADINNSYYQLISNTNQNITNRSVNGLSWANTYIPAVGNYDLQIKQGASIETSTVVAKLKVEVKSLKQHVSFITGNASGTITLDTATKYIPFGSLDKNNDTGAYITSDGDNYAHLNGDDYVVYFKDGNNTLSFDDSVLNEDPGTLTFLQIVISGTDEVPVTDGTDGTDYQLSTARALGFTWEGLDIPAVGTYDLVLKSGAAIETATEVTRFRLVVFSPLTKNVDTGYNAYTFPVNDLSKTYRTIMRDSVVDNKANGTDGNRILKFYKTTLDKQILKSVAVGAHNRLPEYALNKYYVLATKNETDAITALTLVSSAQDNTITAGEIAGLSTIPLNGPHGINIGQINSVDSGTENLNVTINGSIVQLAYETIDGKLRVSYKPFPVGTKALDNHNDYIQFGSFLYSHNQSLEVVDKTDSSLDNGVDNFMKPQYSSATVGRTENVKSGLVVKNVNGQNVDIINIGNDDGSVLQNAFVNSNDESVTVVLFVYKTVSRQLIGTENDSLQFIKVEDVHIGALRADSTGAVVYEKFNELGSSDSVIIDGFVDQSSVNFNNYIIPMASMQNEDGQVRDAYGQYLSIDDSLATSSNDESATFSFNNNTLNGTGVIKQIETTFDNSAGTAGEYETATWNTDLDSNNIYDVTTSECAVFTNAEQFDHLLISDGTTAVIKFRINDPNGYDATTVSENGVYEILNASGGVVASVPYNEVVRPIGSTLTDIGFGIVDGQSGTYSQIVEFKFGQAGAANSVPGTLNPVSSISSDAAWDTDTNPLLYLSKTNDTSQLIAISRANVTTSTTYLLSSLEKRAVAYKILANKDELYNVALGTNKLQRTSDSLAADTEVVAVKVEMKLPVYADASSCITHFGSKAIDQYVGGSVNVIYVIEKTDSFYNNLALDTNLEYYSDQSWVYLDQTSELPSTVDRNTIPGILYVDYKTQTNIQLHNSILSLGSGNGLFLSDAYNGHYNMTIDTSSLSTPLPGPSKLTTVVAQQDDRLNSTVVLNVKSMDGLDVANVTLHNIWIPEFINMNDYLHALQQGSKQPIEHPNLPIRTYDLSTAYNDINSLFNKISDDITTNESTALATKSANALIQNARIESKLNVIKSLRDSDILTINGRITIMTGLNNNVKTVISQGVTYKRIHEEYQEMLKRSTAQLKILSILYFLHSQLVRVGSSSTSYPLPHASAPNVVGVYNDLKESVSTANTSLAAIDTTSSTDQIDLDNRNDVIELNNIKKYAKYSSERIRREHVNMARDTYVFAKYMKDVDEFIKLVNETVKQARS